MKITGAVQALLDALVYAVEIPSDLENEDEQLAFLGGVRACHMGRTAGDKFSVPRMQAAHKRGYDAGHKPN